jgi:hypothetical protein
MKRTRKKSAALKPIVAITAVVALFLVAGATASAQFEGTVRMKTVTYLDGDSNVILPTVSFKGPLFAAVIETPPGPAGEAATAASGGRFILRGDKGVMWIIADREKKYIEIPVAKNDPPADSGAGAPKKKPYTLTKTGQERTILGYPCEEWIADEGAGVTSRIWATGTLGGIYADVVQWFDGMSMETPGDHTRWEREIAGLKLFPLQVVRSEEGEVVEREEVLAVDRKAVAGKTFDEPSGYQKQSVDLNFEKMFEKMMKEMDKEDGADSAGGRVGDGGR